MPKQKAPKTASEITEIRISFPTSAFFSSGIRDFIFSLTKKITHFPDLWAFRFQSVVDELCNNAIEHGSKKNAPIECLFRISPNHYFETIIQDEGKGGKSYRAEEIQQALSKSEKKDAILISGVRGRGLSHIVAPIMDEIEFSDRKNGGISVRVRKYFHSHKK